MRLHGDLGTFFCREVSVHVERVTFAPDDPWVIYVFRHGLEVLGKKFRCDDTLFVGQVFRWLHDRLREIGDEGDLACRRNDGCSECRSACRAIALTLAGWLGDSYPEFLDRMGKVEGRTPEVAV